MTQEQNSPRPSAGRRGATRRRFTHLAFPSLNVTTADLLRCVCDHGSEAFDITGGERGRAEARQHFVLSHVRQSVSSRGGSTSPVRRGRAAAERSTAGGRRLTASSSAAAHSSTITSTMIVISEHLPWPQVDDRLRTPRSRPAPPWRRLRRFDRRRGEMNSVADLALRACGLSFSGGRPGLQIETVEFHSLGRRWECLRERFRSRQRFAATRRIRIRVCGRRIRLPRAEEVVA